MGYFPQNAEGFNGMRHVMLTGGSRSQPLTERELIYQLAHLNSSDEPDDWFFDTLQIGIRPSSGNSIGADWNRGTTMSGEGDFYAIPCPNPSTKADWDEILETLFQPGIFLDAMDKTIERLKSKLPARQYKHNVIISMPYPGINQARFGRLEPNGKILNFSVLGQNLMRATLDRLEAAEWFVDEAIRRFEAAAYKNIHLLGFYWVFETVYRGWDVDDHYLLKELHRHVNGKGYKMFWIPFWASYNVHLLDDYQNYYFDCAWLQPNYMFYKAIKGVREGAEAARARNAGFELEYYFELDEPIAVGAERHKRFRDYLNGGVDYGYMHGSCAYFIGGGGIQRLYHNDDPVEREFYEDIYHFVKGDYQRKG